MKKISNQELLSQLFFEQKEEVKEKKSNNSLKTSCTPMYLKAWRKKHPNAYRDGRIYVFNEY